MLLSRTWLVGGGAVCLTARGWLCLLRDVNRPPVASLVGAVCYGALALKPLPKHVAPYSDIPPSMITGPHPSQSAVLLPARVLRAPWIPPTRHIISLSRTHFKFPTPLSLSGTCQYRCCRLHCSTWQPVACGPALVVAVLLWVPGLGMAAGWPLLPRKSCL